MSNEPLPPGDTYWLLVEPIWDVISIYDGPETFLEQFATASEAAGHLFAAHWCQSEVGNGGFEQFFENSTGVLGPEAVAGYEAVGMPKLADVVRQALSIFGNTYPRDTEIRNKQLGEVDTSGLEELEDKFYELIESENGGWDAAADRYALANGAQPGGV